MASDDQHSRTELAEDRTLLASERTFAGWLRTSLGCIGIAVGFKALFGTVEPRWVPQLIATLLLALAVFIAWAAERRARSVRSRLSSHVVAAAAAVNLTLVALAVSIAAIGLALAFWLLPAK